MCAKQIKNYGFAICGNFLMLDLIFNLKFKICFVVILNRQNQVNNIKNVVKLNRCQAS